MRLLAVFLGLAFGFSNTVPTGVTGNLRLGELATPFLAPLAYYWLTKGDELYRKKIGSMLGCICALFVWHGFVDSLHNTPLSQTLDIIGTLGFLAVKLLVFTVFFVKDRFFAVSTIAGLAVGQYLFREEIKTSVQIMDAEYWDLEVASWGGPLLITILIIAGRFSSIFVFLAAVVYGCAAGFYGARSHGLCIIIGAIIPWFVFLVKRKNLLGQRRSILKISLICLAASFFVTFAYVQAAKSGWLTRKSQEQVNALENPYNPLEIAWSARGGTLIGLVGALEHPFFGFGSKEFYTDEYNDSGLELNWLMVHSVVVESMAYAGVLTMAFWFVFFKNVFDVFPSTDTNSIRPLSINIVASISFALLMWSALFSPFVSSRLDFPILIATLFYCHVSYERFKRNVRVTLIK